MRFIKFALFPIVHLSIFQTSENFGTPFSKAITAIIGSIPEALSIMPLEIAKIALQLDSENLYRNNMFIAMEKVYSQQGISGFAVGYFGIQLRQAAWSAGYFASIKFFESNINKLIRIFNNEDLSIQASQSVEKYRVISQLLSGFLAGMFGAAINTPFDTIRSTLQKRALSGLIKGQNHKLGVSLLGVGQDIVSSKGISGLYTGFAFKACHLGGGGALMAFFIPFFKQLLDNSEWIRE
jgi:hypothetical protein